MRRSLAAFLMMLVAPLAASGQDEATLAQRIARLEQDLHELRTESADADRLLELERRLDLLAAELEKERTRGATVPESAEGQKGLGPAASRIYRSDHGVSIAGYGEAIYQNFAGSRQDAAPSNRVDQADFLRSVLYVGYKFSDRVLFNSEIEFEHGSTGKGGEVSVEFGYLDYQITKSVGIRAGMLLVPVGLLNELHEPTIYSGARRPDVESTVIPSTWRELGAGLFGEIGPFEWRAYAVAGLNAAGLTSSGIRGSRQSGARSKADDWALTGRVDFEGASGLLVGASAFSGGSGQGASLDGADIDARVSVYEAHAQYQWRGLTLRALASAGRIGDAALVNSLNDLSGKASVGEKQHGWYGEASFDVASLVPSTRWSFVPFVRYEALDTQDGVPPGYTDDPATARTVLTAGLSVKPLHSVVLKLDHQILRNEARTGVNQWNIAIGYVF